MDADVCVVTQPLGESDTTATGELLDILSAITSVSLVTIALADDRLREEYEVVEVSDRGFPASISRAAWDFGWNQLRLARVLWRRDEEVVLFFGAVAYVLPIVVARLSGKVVIVEPRADVPLALRVRWERRVPSAVARLLAGLVAGFEAVGYRAAHAIVTYTPEMATELGLDRYEHKLHPHGARFIDLETFAPLVPFDEREIVVGYLGRLDEEKGIRSFANAVSLLPDSVTVRIVGGGPLEEWLEEELAAEVEAGRVELVGWVDHDRVPDDLSQMRLLVLPSHATEGLPTTILEAFACGTPVLATPVSGVPSVVSPGKTGAFLDGRDPETIATAVAEVLGEPLEDMSDRCRALVEREYDFEAAVDRYRQILGAVLDANR